jgi:acetyl esterase/lipase
MMLDGDGSTAVADAAKQFGFANPTAGRTIADVADVPIFLVRAGKDEFPGVNESIDRFVRQAMERNLPLSFVNHPHVPHAFDLVDDGDDTRAIIQQIVDFLRQHLGVHR